MKAHFYSRSIGVLALALMATSSQLQAQTPGTFAIKPDDRIVFYGDSITDSRQYTNMVETYIVTRFPQHKVFFVHSGWGGDRVGGGGGGSIDVRLQRDVIEHKPTVMTIMLGMNDGGRSAFNRPTFDTFSKGYKSLVTKVKEAVPGVRITGIVPSPYDDVTRPPAFEGGYNSVLLKFGDYIKELAKEENLTVADLNTPVVAMLTKANQKDPAVAAKLIGDRVHPGGGGHIIMAQALLQAWNAPAIVTAVDIDAAGKKVARAENTTVTDLAIAPIISWNQLDKALPFPVGNGADIQLAVSSSDFVATLNQQPLKVTGLTAPKYSLKIAGSDVGTFTREELAAGVNLATLATPMFAQAHKVAGLTSQRSAAFNNRWRNVQVPLLSITSPRAKAVVATSLPAILEALDAEVAELAGAQRAAAQPVAQKYELVPAT